MAYAPISSITSTRNTSSDITPYSSYTYPANSVSISNNCYKGNKNILSIDLQNIPWTNNSMYNAFAGCSNLKSVFNISNTVKNMSSTFDSCINLIDPPTIPNSVTELQRTFYQCYNMTSAPTIPNSVVNMVGTFTLCNMVTSLPNIPNSVINCSGMAAYGMWNVTSLGTFSQNCVNCYNTFYGVGTSTSSLDASNVIIPASCTNAVNMFAYSAIKDKVPSVADGCQTINAAFFGCWMNTGPIFLGNCTSMVSAFGRCYNLTTATIPNGLVNGAYAFQDCNKLTTITGNIPSTTQNVYFMFAQTNLYAMKNLYVESENITNAVYFVSYAGDVMSGVFPGPFNVYIPFKYTNGEYTATYNAFTAAQYTTSGSYKNVYLKNWTPPS